MSANTIAGSSALRVAAAASVLAGVTHFAAVPDHRAEWWLAALLFTVVGAFQIIWGAAALNEHRSAVLQSAVVVNAVAILVWLVSRTVGLPFGPESGQAESVDVLSVACVLAELAVIVGTSLAVRSRSTEQSTDGSEASLAS
jgi:hypothetical protein